MSKPNAKPRKVYLCRKCGLPLKGHTCLAAGTGAASSNGKTLVEQEKQEETADALNKEKAAPDLRKTKKVRKRKTLKTISSMPKKRKRPRALEEDSDWSSACNDDDDADDSLGSLLDTHPLPLSRSESISRRTPSTRKRKPSPSNSDWTAVMAPAHVFHDSIQERLPVAQKDEQAFLIQWNAAVQERLSDQNDWMKQNRELVLRRRQLDKQVSKQRTKLVKLSSKIRREQAENARLSGELQKGQEEGSRDASRFLSVLEDLASA